MDQNEKSLIRTRIAKIMKNERKIRSLSQMDMCALLGITQGFLSKIESDLVIPETVVWLKFCSLFQVYPDLPMNEKLCDLHFEKQNELLAKKALLKNARLQDKQRSIAS